MALLVDRDHDVCAANQAARTFFGIEPERLPLSLVDATREGRLVDVLGTGKPEEEIRLSHRRRTVQTRLVPGPTPGDVLLFITDVTELRRLDTVRQEVVATPCHQL